MSCVAVAGRIHPSQWTPPPADGGWEGGFHVRLQRAGSSFVFSLFGRLGRLLGRRIGQMCSAFAQSGTSSIARSRCRCCVVARNILLLPFCPRSWASTVATYCTSPIHDARAMLSAMGHRSPSRLVQVLRRPTPPQPRSKCAVLFARFAQIIVRGLPITNELLVEGTVMGLPPVLILPFDW